MGAKLRIGQAQIPTKENGDMCGEIVFNTVNTILTLWSRGFGFGLTHETSHTIFIPSFFYAFLAYMSPPYPGKKKKEREDACYGQETPSSWKIL